VRKLLFLFAVLYSSAFATSYYVTQSGSATPLSTNSGSPSSVATYNASNLPAGGDTVHFSGTITSTIAPNTSGTGNGAGRLILEFSAATLNGPGDNSRPRILISNKNYISLLGGGYWTQGLGGVDSTYTPGCIIGSHQSHAPTGALDYGDNFVYFNQQPSHDIKIDGFQSVLSNGGTNAGFILGWYVSTLQVTNCNVQNLSNLFFSDTPEAHDYTFKDNYFLQSVNVVQQSDCLAFGDLRDILIEGNKIVLRSPGAQAGGRHNDLFQVFQSGSSTHQTVSGITIRYNWLEQRVTSSNGDGSITFTQLEQISDASGFALKIYGNIIYGNNSNPAYATGGLGGGDTYSSHTVYVYNNTYIARNTPSGAFGWHGTGSIYIRNGIFWAPSAFSDSSGWSVTMSAGATWNKNFFYNWSDASSTLSGGSGSLSTNPLFTAQASDDYSLGASSTLRGIADTTIGSEYGTGIAFGATWPGPSTVARPSGAWDIGAYQYVSGGDTTAPTPNPSMIASATATGTTTATVVANTATDATTPPVQYAVSTDNGSTWSAWQSSATFNITGLTASTTYQCKVKARDSATTPNETTPTATASSVTTNSTASSRPNPRARALTGGF